MARRLDAKADDLRGVLGLAGIGEGDPDGVKVLKTVEPDLALRDWVRRSGRRGFATSAAVSRGRRSDQLACTVEMDAEKPIHTKCWPRG
jgi:hypothetical protein